VIFKVNTPCRWSKRIPVLLQPHGMPKLASV